MHEPSVPPERLPPTRTSASRDAVQRWRLVVRRDALDPDRAQRTVLDDWGRALVASGLPVAGLDAPSAKPRYAIAAPLAAAVPGEAELVDIWLTERLPRWRVREALEPVMPASHWLVDLADVWLGEPALPGRVVASVFRATMPTGDLDPAALRAAAEALLASPTLIRERRKGETTVTYDLRPFIGVLEVDTGPGAGSAVTLRMTLRHDPEKGIGRPDEILAALADSVGNPSIRAATLVRERLVLGEPVVPEPSPRRPPGRRQPDGGAGPGSVDPRGRRGPVTGS